MTAQTSRYHIQYPTGSDLVSNIPQHIQNAANSIEAALADVDDRHTTAAYTTVVRSTLSQLLTVKAQVGQLGYVTGGNTAAQGMYVFMADGWHAHGVRNINSALTNVINSQFWRFDLYTVKLIDDTTLTIDATIRRKDGDWRGNGGSNPDQQLCKIPDYITYTDSMLPWSYRDCRSGSSLYLKNDHYLYLNFDAGATTWGSFKANTVVDHHYSVNISINYSTLAL